MKLPLALLVLALITPCFLLPQKSVVTGKNISQILEKYFENANFTEEDLARDVADGGCVSVADMERFSPSLTNVEFQLRTNTSSESFALTELEKIVTSANFDKDKNLVIYISGFLIGLPRSGQKTVENAYHIRNDTNFVATDSTHFIKSIYQWSFFSVPEIGKTIAEGIARLVEEKMFPLERIHLIGHSLGVPIAGYVGSHFKQTTGKTIPRITGLDPANSCFDEDTNIGLKLGDAEFIDIIHTNPGVMGNEVPLGNVDFFVGGLNYKQPGCIMFGCSHIRACHYYAETVHPDNANNFLSVPCPSLDEVNAEACQGPAIRMGYKVPLNANGIYYLEVNRKTPFGKNDTYQEEVEEPGGGGGSANLLLNGVLLSIAISLSFIIAGS